MYRHMRFVSMLLANFACLLQLVQVASISEVDRVRIFHSKYSWPPVEHFENEAYKTYAAGLEKEIMDIKGGDERWENWMQFVQGRMVPAFTDNGFKIIETPQYLQESLTSVVNNYVKDWNELEYEEGMLGSGGPLYNPLHLEPKFIPRQALWDEVHQEMLPLLEEWSGVKLFPTSIYGIRLYQNRSSLVMHRDKIHSHVISCIMHIQHEYDNDDEPWPIEIEGHDGKIHSVALAAGQTLFYESAKCLHGRMTELRGKYYGSIFVHYQPVDKSIWNYSTDDIIERIPPHWRDGVEYEHGSRWAGQAITVDSLVAANAPDKLSLDSQPFEPERFIPEFDSNDEEYQEEIFYNEEARKERIKSIKVEL